MQELTALSTIKIKEKAKNRENKCWMERCRTEKTKCRMGR